MTVHICRHAAASGCTNPGQAFRIMSCRQPFGAVIELERTASCQAKPFCSASPCTSAMSLHDHDTCGSCLHARAMSRALVDTAAQCSACTGSSLPWRHASALLRASACAVAAAQEQQQVAPVRPLQPLQSTVYAARKETANALGYSYDMPTCSPIDCPEIAMSDRMRHWTPLYALQIS